MLIIPQRLKIGRRFSCALIASSLLFVLTLVIVPHCLPAFSYATPGVEPVSTITIGGGGSISLSVTSGQFRSSSQSITVTTTNYTGYTMTIAPADGGSTELVNINNPNATLPSISTSPGSSITASDFAGLSTAAYGLSTDDGASYKPVANNAVIATTDSATDSTTGSFNLTLGAKVLTNTPAGVYTKAFTLTAIANAVTYAITYNANAGTDTVTNMPSPNPQVSGSVSGSNLTLSSAVPVRNGYRFLGWSTNSSATAATYAASSIYTLDKTTDNIVTLYAVWERSVATCTKQYRLQNADGTYPASYTSDTSEQIDIGSTCSYSKSVTDYQSQSTNGTVTEQGLTLSLDLPRNTYTCTKQYHLQNADGSYPSTWTSGGSESVRWGATCNYSQSATDYTTQSTSVTMGKADQTLRLELPRTTYTCTKQYHLQNADGSYPSTWTSGGSESVRWGATCSYSQSASYYTTQSTSATMGKANQTLRLELPRTTYTCTKQYRLQNADGSYPSTWTSGGSESVRWGATCNYSQSASYYTTQSTSATMGKANQTLQVSLPRTTYTCTKQYRLQNADGSYPSTWTSGGSESVRWGATCSYSQSATDYTTQSTSATMGKANQTLQVSLPRTTYALTVSNGNTAAISSVSGGGSYRWGQSVSISAAVNEDFEFTGWSQTAGTSSSFASASSASTTFTMPKSAATVSASGQFALTLSTLTKAKCQTYASDSSITPKGTNITVRSINGVCIMTTDYASGKTWSEAQNTCPSGWTLPSQGLAGLLTGTTYVSAFNPGGDGKSWWTGQQVNNTQAYTLRYQSSLYLNYDTKTTKNYVRCVRSS